LVASASVAGALVAGALVAGVGNTGIVRLVVIGWMTGAERFVVVAVDKAAALSFAMDLTPLVRDDGLSVTDYALGFIRRFEAEVMDRLRKLCVSERPSALKTA